MTRSAFMAAALFSASACVTVNNGDGGNGNGDVTIWRGGEAIDGVFPAKDKLDAIAGDSLPAVQTQPARAVVTSWALTGPFPERVGSGPITSKDAVSALVLASVPAASTSEAMRCVARELGRFVAMNDGKRPEPRLERFIILRCGGNEESVSYNTLSWKNVDAAAKDQEIIEQGKPQVKGILTGFTDQGMLVGGAFIRVPEKKLAYLFFAAEKTPASLAAAEQKPVDGKFVVAGTLDKSPDAELMLASITAGPLGAEDCERDASSVLPAFRFVCPVAAGDAVAFVDLYARSKGRVLETPVGSVLVVQKPDAARVWNRVDLGLKPSPGTLAPSFLAALNQMRAAAGVAPVAEAAAESAVVAKLAPHYFNALAGGGNSKTVDTVALGVLAGWDVDTFMIHDAGFAALYDYTGHVDQLFADAFDRPYLRQTLLGKEVAAVALGASATPEGVEGIVIGTYQALRPPQDPAAAAKAIFEKLRSERQQRGLGPVLGVIPIDDLVASASKRLQAGEALNTVGEETLRQTLDRMSRPVNLFELEIYDIDHIAFPEQLLTGKTTYAAMALATHKRPDAPWGSTELLIFFLAEDAPAASTPAE